MPTPNDPTANFHLEGGATGENWDDLFPAEGTETTPAAATPASPDPTLAPVAPEFVINAKTGSKYKTLDDATHGIEEKDTRIAELRQKLIEATGVDPLNGQPVQRPTSTVQPAEINYAQDPDRFYKDLSDATSKGDARSFHGIMNKFMEDKFAPYAPTIAQFARVQAVDSVSTTAPEFRQFIGSQDYQDVLESMPVLKRGIQVAENIPQYQSELPQLYEMAYLAAQGRKLAAAPPTTAHPVAAAPTPTRTTLSSTTTTPPPPSPNTQNWARDKVARKQLIQDYENRGIADKVW